MNNYKLYKSNRIHDLREMLQQNAKIYAARPLFYEKVNGEYAKTTYAQFYADVKFLGGALMRRGLEGKRIIVTGENCYAWCLSYMTAVCGLGVVIPVDKEIPAEELANIA